MSADTSRRMDWNPAVIWSAWVCGLNRITRLDRALDESYRLPANQRLANHLLRERQAIFTFLYCPGLDTYYRAEQAIRPMVVMRKMWGGNRTEHGAHTQSILNGWNFVREKRSCYVLCFQSICLQSRVPFFAATMACGEDRIVRENLRDKICVTRGVRNSNAPPESKKSTAATFGSGSGRGEG